MSKTSQIIDLLLELFFLCLFIYCVFQQDIKVALLSGVYYLAQKLNHIERML